LTDIKDDTIFSAVTKAIEKLLADMRVAPAGIKFSDAAKVATYFFGEPRNSGSHRVFKTPWPGDPRINLQEGEAGKAKAYQVRQLILAIDKLAEIKVATAKAGKGDKNA